VIYLRLIAFSEANDLVLVQQRRCAIHQSITMAESQNRVIQRAATQDNRSRRAILIRCWKSRV